MQPIHKLSIEKDLPNEHRRKGDNKDPRMKRMPRHTHIHTEKQINRSAPSPLPPLQYSTKISIQYTVGRVYIHLHTPYIYIYVEREREMDIDDRYSYTNTHETLRGNREVMIATEYHKRSGSGGRGCEW